jgi:ribosomal protein S17
LKFSGIRISDEQFKSNMARYGNIISIRDVNPGVKIVEFTVIEEAERWKQQVAERNLIGLTI